MIRDFFRELLEYVNDSCEIPGINEKISYGDEWESKARTALTIAEKACAFESEKDNKEYRSATQEWKKIFGDRFEY